MERQCWTFLLSLHRPQAEETRTITAAIPPQPAKDVVWPKAVCLELGCKPFQHNGEGTEGKQQAAPPLRGAQPSHPSQPSARQTRLWQPNLTLTEDPSKHICLTLQPPKVTSVTHAQQRTLSTPLLATWHGKPCLSQDESSKQISRNMNTDSPCSAADPTDNSLNITGSHKHLVSSFSSLESNML